MSLSMIKKLSSLLDRQQKFKIVGIMMMILLGGLLETLGVSLILPLVEAILDEEAFAQKTYVVYVSNLFGISNTRTMIYLLLVGLIAMFIIKNAYLVFSTYVQSKFVNNNRCRCTTNLLAQYLNRPYEYYLYAETSDILRTIYGDMDNIFNLLLQCMNLAAELVVSMCLGIFLLFVDIKMMLVIVGLLLVATIFISKVIKRNLNKVGEASREAQADLYKWILQSITGIKDVKVTDRQKYFIDKYKSSASDYANCQVKNNVLTNVPRLLIETVSMAGILLYILVSLMLGVGLSSLLPLVSAFALAAMRLLPSVNRVNTYMANIAYYEPALNYIYENVDASYITDENQKIIENNNSAIELNEKIILEDIVFSYPETDKKIFDHANMEVPVGKSVGVVGPSGSGKTTVVDILLGLLKLQDGSIKSDGIDIFSNYSSWLSHIGYIPQTIYMLDDSIKKNIAFGVKDEDIDEERVWEVLKEAQLESFVNELPDKLDAQIGERGVRISGGQRQRLGIARALYHNPELLIFDEATSALDNDTETAIMEAIDKLHGKKTMVIIAHRLRTIENCDIIYEVKDGKIKATKGR